MRESDIERAALRSVPSTTASLVGIERNAARNNRSRSLTALLAVLGWSAILSTTGAESTMAAIVTKPNAINESINQSIESMINIEYHTRPSSDGARCTIAVEIAFGDGEMVGSFGEVLLEISELQHDVVLHLGAQTKESRALLLGDLERIA